MIEIRSYLEHDEIDKKEKITKKIGYILLHIRLNLGECNKTFEKENKTFEIEKKKLYRELFGIMCSTIAFLILLGILYLLMDDTIILIQISFQNILDQIFSRILLNKSSFPFVLIFPLFGYVNNSKRERKSPEEIVKTIFNNASATPRSINKIAQEGELQWNTAEKYIRLIELIQSLPLQIIRTEGGHTYISRIPAEKLTFDQKIDVYKILYSPRLTKEHEILILLLSKPEGETLKETPEIKHLAKIGRIKKEGDRYFLTRDGEIIAKGLNKMFSEEIRETEE